MAARRLASPDLHGAYPIGHECPEASKLEPGVHHVQCLSGYHRDVEIPSIKQWIRFGRIPNPLLGIAIKTEWEDYRPEAMTPEDRLSYLDFQDVVVSEMCIPKIPLDFVRGARNVGTDDAPVWEELPPHLRLPREDHHWLLGVADGSVPVGERAALLDAMSTFRRLAERAELLGDRPSNGSEPAGAARH